jgi:hypothetical protein
LTVTVTAKAPDATKEIRERVKRLAAVKDPGADVHHDGKGNGGGGIGRCPIVLKDTALDVKDVEGGSQVSVKAKKSADADALRKEARDRAAIFDAKTAPATVSK